MACSHCVTPCKQLLCCLQQQASWTCASGLLALVAINEPQCRQGGNYAVGERDTASTVTTSCWLPPPRLWLPWADPLEFPCWLGALSSKAKGATGMARGRQGATGYASICTGMASGCLLLVAGCIRRAKAKRTPRWCLGSQPPRGELVWWGGVAHARPPLPGLAVCFG